MRFVNVPDDSLVMLNAVNELPIHSLLVPGAWSQPLQPHSQDPQLHGEVAGHREEEQIGAYDDSGTGRQGNELHRVSGLIVWTDRRVVGKPRHHGKRPLLRQAHGELQQREHGPGGVGDVKERHVPDGHYPCLAERAVQDLSCFGVASTPLHGHQVIEGGDDGPSAGRSGKEQHQLRQ